MKKLIRVSPLVTKSIKDLQSGFAKVNHVIYKTNERRKRHLEVSIPFDTRALQL